MLPALTVSRSLSFRPFLRIVHDRNPFYLLSALCMFIGFRVILGALNSAPGDWKTLLGLIITLNVYEILMIALALFLIIGRHLRRDGWILLGIEAMFLVDLTNLNAELFTAMPRLGAVVNGICLILAMIKILFITHMLGLHIPRAMAVFIAAQLGLLLGLPGIFRLLQSSAATISPLQIYGIWWVVALVIAAGAFVVNRHLPSDHTPMAALPWRLYVLLPMVSLLVHLCSENRVYWVHFQLANIAPVLLAIALVLKNHRYALRWSFGLMALAILVSITPEEYPLDLTRRLFDITFSPMRLILLATWLMSVWLAIRHHSALIAAACTAAVVLAVIGNNLAAIYHYATHILDVIWDYLCRLIPETGLQWGYTAITAAFLLLAVGAVVSLRATPPAEMEKP